MNISEEKIPVRQPLLGLTQDELRGLAVSWGLPAFAGKQLAGWIYGKRVAAIADMTSLSKAVRERLGASYTVGLSAPVEERRSADGTVKYLFRTRDGHFVETVCIPDGGRATLCVSCQVGCKMGCKFCMTGRQGFSASLTAADILNQIHALPERDKLTNIVFMGQGEPLDNLTEVLRAITVLTAPWGWAWSPRRITVSTVGLSAGKLSCFLDNCECHLAVSLHHPLPDGRAALMPAERAFGIARVVDVLKQYACFRRRGGGVRTMSDDDGPRQRRLTFEYIVFQGLNDSLRHADALLRLLDGLECRVNLIPFHSIPEAAFQGASREKMVRFRDYLTTHGLFTTIRASRGQDIWAACGLLSTKVQEGRRGGGTADD